MFKGKRLKKTKKRANWFPYIQFERREKSGCHHRIAGEKYSLSVLKFHSLIKCETSVSIAIEI